MTIDEFRSICQDIFYLKGEGKNRKRKGFPKGCTDCPNIDDPECHEDCLWPQNYWKYEEAKQFWLLTKATNGGMDLNRLESLQIDDFIKISIIKEYI